MRGICAWKFYGAILALTLLVILGADHTDYTSVLLVIMVVLLAEIINTALERAVDIIKPHKHPYARVIKDLSAAFVFTSVVFAVIIGFIVYIPLLADFYTEFLSFY